jgi:hypothetical protein
VAVQAVLLLSVTVTVKVDVPIVVGVPEISPAELNDNPAGKLPVVTANVYGLVPPVATTDWLYPTVCEPFGNVVVVIVGLALTVNVVALDDATQVLPSVTSHV